MTRFSAADLLYDSRTHTSTLPNGAEVPHVTRILSDVGVSTNFEDVAQVSRRTEEAVRVACLRGTAVHADCHAYDDDDLDWSTVHALVRPYVEAWALVRQRKGLRPVTRERRIYHPTFNYTGILDGVFEETPTGRLVLVDLKTGDPEDAAAHLQTAAYEAAYCAQSDAEIHRRWAVWLQPGKKVPYRIVDYGAPQRRERFYDFGKFQACLTVWNEQPGRRKKAA